MNETMLVVEVRRGMVECVYSDVPNIRILVVDHDGEKQGYGHTVPTPVEVYPLSKLAI
jgi:hypothetical protein